MNNARHSPSPWILYVEKNGSISINMTDDDGSCGPQIASILSENCDDESQLWADATVIEQSPIMLALCRKVLAALKPSDGINGDHWGLCDELEQVISMATRPEQS